MKVLNADIVHNFGVKHSQAKIPLESWLLTAKNANWRHLLDVKATYRHTDDSVKGVYTVFNIKGNDYRLIALINYQKGTIAVTEIFTHAEDSHWSKTK